MSRQLAMTAPNAVANVDLSSRPTLSENPAQARVEAALRTALEHATAPGCPRGLADALRYALFPGGARLRPQLCVLVAIACGDRHPHLSDGAAAALELLHCASLVHDDLPVFDDAPTRRGKPSLHRVFGSAAALLTGDALIVMSFDVLARAASSQPDKIGLLLSELAVAAGPTRGIVAGQAWEGEPLVDVDEYHRAKTASLFEAAATMGAIAGGGDAHAWRVFGEMVGRAYQSADDLRDATGNEAELGKPTGRDIALNRPNVVASLGEDGARVRLRELLRAVRACCPPCHGQRDVLAWVDRYAASLASR